MYVELANVVKDVLHCQGGSHDYLM